MNGKEVVNTGTFAIENSYSAPAVFALLTRDYKSHSVAFENNWDQIATPEYDPVGSLSARVEANLLATYVKGVDRFTKVLIFTAQFDSSRFRRNSILGYKKENVEELQSILYQQGVDVDFVHRRGEASYVGHFVSKNIDSSVGIHPDPSFLLLTYPTHENYTMTLDTLENFTKRYTTFFDLLEKTLRAAYALNKQDLPPQILRFNETPTIGLNHPATEFLVNCSYCNTNYAVTPKSVDCPHCGASKPIFQSE